VRGGALSSAKGGNVIGARDDEGKAGRSTKKERKLQKKKGFSGGLWAEESLGRKGKKWQKCLKRKVSTGEHRWGFVCWTGTYSWTGEGGEGAQVRRDQCTEREKEDETIMKVQDP